MSSRHHSERQILDLEKRINEEIRKYRQREAKETELTRSLDFFAVINPQRTPNLREEVTDLVAIVLGKKGEELIRLATSLDNALLLLRSLGQPTKEEGGRRILGIPPASLSLEELLDD